MEYYLILKLIILKKFPKVFFNKIIIYKENHFLGVKELFENLDSYYFSARVKKNLTYYYINLNNMKKCFIDFPKFKEFFFTYHKPIYNYLNKLVIINNNHFENIKRDKKNFNICNKKESFQIKSKFSNKFLWKKNNEKKKYFKSSKFNKKIKVNNLEILTRDKKAIRLMNFNIERKKTYFKIKENIFDNKKSKNYINTFSNGLVEKFNKNIFFKIQKKNFRLKTDMDFRIKCFRSTSTKNFSRKFFN